MTKRAHQEAKRLSPVGLDGIENIRKIVKEGSAAKVNEFFVDVFSGSAILAIYDKVKPENQAKIRSFSVGKAATVCLNLLNKYANGSNSAVGGAQ